VTNYNKKEGFTTYQSSMTCNPFPIKFINPFHLQAIMNVYLCLHLTKTIHWNYYFKTISNNYWKFAVNIKLLLRFK